MVFAGTKLNDDLTRPHRNIMESPCCSESIVSVLLISCWIGNFKGEAAEGGGDTREFSKRLAVED